MAGQARTLVVLAGVLVAGVAAAIWVMSADPAGSGPEVRDEPAAAHEDGTSQSAPAPARERPKRNGTASVFGVIKRTAGQAPVPGQEVLLVPPRGDPFSVATDEQGAFRFDKLPHGGPFELSAAAKGCGTIRIPGIALDRNEQCDLGTLYLDPAVKLTVRVRTLFDRPVEGAFVEAFAVVRAVDWDWSKALAQAAQAPVAVAHATTGKDGEAIFPEMAVGTWTLTAKKEGFGVGGARSVSVRSDQEPRPVTIWLGPGHPLAGRVLSASKTPVAGALVLAGPTNSGWDIAATPLRSRATSDAEGRYAFPALEAGETQLWVAEAGGAPTAAAVVQVPLVARFDIVMKGSGTLSGRVTAEDGGLPIEGVAVRAISWDTGQTYVAQAVSDAEGRYSIALRAGTINQIRAEKEGLLLVPVETTAANRVSTLHEGETVVKDLKMRHPARLCGIVKSAVGPISGVQVTASFGRPNEGYQQKTTTSGVDGRYEFAQMEKGTVLVTARKEGWFQQDAPDNVWATLQSASAASDFKVEVPETGVATKDVELRPGTSIDGIVLGPDDKPLAGVRVFGAGAAESAPSGTDGAFHLGGVRPSPTTQLYPVCDGYGPATTKSFAVGDQPVTGVTLRMLREPHVRGTITSASGAPLTETHVLVATKRAGQENPWEETNRWANAARAPVREDGSYDIPLQARASTQIVVRAVSLGHQQTDSKPIDVVEGQETYQVDLVLGEGRELSGVVVMKAGGAAVVGAYVAIAPHSVSGNQMRYGSTGVYPVWAVTDADGAFRVPHLAAGGVDVRVESEGFVPALTSVDLDATSTVRLELSPALTIEGFVLFADGRPAAGVDVQAQTGSRGSFGSMMENTPAAQTDAKGAFRLKDLAEGAYTLNVAPPWGSDAGIQTKQVPGVVAGSRDVKITVESGGSISGRVLDSKRRPITNVWINAGPVPKEGRAQSGNEWRNAQVKPDGSFVLGGLAEGPYRVQVGAGGGAAGGGYRPVVLESVAVGTKDLEIVMEDGLAIVGTLLDDAGAPLVQVPVQALGVDAGNRSSNANAWTDSEGRFNLSGLLPGNYRLEIPAWGGGQNRGYTIDGSLTAVAGTTDLKLTATKGVSIWGSVVDETGHAITEGWVSAVAKSGNQQQGQVKPDGSFEIAGVAPGQVYTVHAQAKNRVAVQLENVAAGARDLRIVLAKGLESSGTLVDAAGKLLPAVNVSFLSSDGKRSQWTQTDAEGKFTVGGLVDGTYEAKVWTPKSDGGGDWKAVGSLTAGDVNVALKVPQ